MRELVATGIDASVYQPQEPCDALIVGQTQRYQALAPLLRRVRCSGTVVILDVTNDVFSTVESHANVERYSGLATPIWWAYRARLRTQRFLHLGNWGNAPGFWQQCDAVVAGSRLQAEKYKGYIPSRYHIVDPVDPKEYKSQAYYSERKPIILVWEGSSDNLPYLRPYISMLRYLSEKGNIRFRVVLDRHRSNPYHGIVDNEQLLREWHLPADFIKWNIHTFSDHLASADIGIAPLPLHDPFSWVKPANKILGYGYLGLPVVASAIPSYVETLNEAHFGFTAVQDEDWITSIERLASDVRLRKEMGERGQLYVRQTHMPQHFARQYLDVIHEVIGGNSESVGTQSGAHA